MATGTAVLVSITCQLVFLVSRLVYVTPSRPIAGEAHIDERIMEEVDYYVPTTGFYYFIFANENEITANFIRAHFDMHKTVFDVSSQVQCNITIAHISFFRQ